MNKGRGVRRIAFGILFVAFLLLVLPRAAAAPLEDVEQKIISGEGGGILNPKGSATRAEVAAMLMLYCKNVE